MGKYTGYVLWASLVAQLVKKKSVCKARDSGSFPGSGKSPGDGIGYPLQYSWAPLAAQTVKNPPAMQETWVDPRVGRSPGGGHGNPPCILAWRIPQTEEPGGLQPMGPQSRTR